MENNIPKAVIKALNDDRLSIELLGDYKGKTAYHAYYKNAHTGFPYVVLFDGKNTEVITGFFALDIITAFEK